jgi:hypothetical protein
MKYIITRLLSIAIHLVWVWPFGAWPQSQSKNTQELPSEICPDGQYVGRPSPGRTSYLKDEYVWAVTREFAKRYCIPEEFIADDLKGAEAIAYRHGKPTGKKTCEIKSGQELRVVNRYGHWLEIYIKTGVIPKYDPEVGFYVRNYVTSANLLGDKSKEKLIEDMKNNNAARKLGKNLEPPGMRRPFYGVGPMADGRRIYFRYLDRITPTQVVERSVALSEHYYLQNWRDGIDLIALEGWSQGAVVGKERADFSPKFGYAIGVTGEVHDAGTLSYPNGFLHVIELPQRIVQVLNTADRAGGKVLEDAIRNLGASMKQPVR